MSSSAAPSSVSRQPVQSSSSRPAVSSAASTAAPSASESVEPSSTSVPPSSSSIPPSSSSSVPPSSSSSSVPPSSSSSIPPSSSSSVPPSSSASSSSASASSSSASASSSSASASASSASASASATSSASSSSASSSDRSTSFSTSFTTEYVTDPNGQSSATSSAVSSAVASGNSNGGSRSSNNVGPIVGGVVGGLAGLALLAVLAWFLWKRNKKQKDQAFDEKMFDPAHRYSRGDPIDLVGGGANEPFTHGAGAAGGTIEPFPFTNPSSPQNTSHGLSHEGAYTGGPGSGSAHGDYFPQSNLNHRLSYPSMPMSMPDARDYAPGAGGSGAGWGYGGDGYATAAGMGAGAAAGAAGIGAFNNRSQAQQQGYHPQHSQQQGYSGYDYRSESTSQSGDSQYPPSSGAHGLGMTALTPAALAKQREATGGGRHQSHPSWGAASGPSGSALPYAQQQPQGLSSPTSPTADRRSSHLSEDHDSPGTNVNRQSGVYVHRDMDDLPEHAMPDELPPTYNANRSSQS